MTLPPSVVPFITAWEREPELLPALIRRRGRGGEGLGYADETAYDRCPYGALWVRQAIARGRGEARFVTVHALRQRRAALDLLCQVCGLPTLPEDEDRVLFLLRDVGRPVAEGEPTSAPPVHLACAATAVRECPPIREGYVTVRVTRPEPWGVAGVLHHTSTLAPIPGKNLVEVPYDTPALRWVRAARALIALRGVTPVDLRAECAAHGIAC